MRDSLPRLDILGMQYEIDVKANKFIPINAAASVKEINISSFEVCWEDDFKLAAYYDKVSRNVIDIPKDIQELPKDMELIGIVIPALIKLDPVGYVALHGLDLNRFSSIPIKELHTAEMIPIEDTLLYQLLKDEGKIIMNDMKTVDDKEKEQHEQPQRKLPGVMMEGTSFFVDVMKEEFREMENQKNVISFEMLVRDGDGYLLFYDPLVKNIPGPDRYQHPDIKSVEIPPLGMMDLEGMAIKYNRNIEEVKGKSDYEIIVDQKVLANRLAGQLPTLDIAGDTFYVDVRLGELRLKDDFSNNGIQFRQMEPYPLIIPQGLRFFYDKETHQTVRFNADTLTAIPKHVIAVEIPVVEKLDPVRIATMYELDMKDFLMKYPPQAEFRARVMDWNETAIPMIIEENKKAIGKKTNKEFYEHKGRTKKRGRSI